MSTAITGATTLVNDQATPTPSDNTPTADHNEGPNSSEQVKYYFVFVALILSFGMLCLFFLLRRRRNRRVRLRAQQEEQQRRTSRFDMSELQPTPGSWDNLSTDRRRYWGSVEAATSLEEGLDEHGHAPPPYRPKTSSGEFEEPSVPEPTLRREDAGFKPPDYSEILAYVTNGPDEIFEPYNAHTPDDTHGTDNEHETESGHRRQPTTSSTS